MEAVEPLGFEVRGGKLDLSNYQRRIRSNDWDATADFLLHEAVKDRCREIGSRTIQEEFSDFLQSKMEPLEQVSPVLSESFSPSIFPASMGQTAIYISGETVVVPNPDSQGVVYVVSNNKNEARSVRDEIESNLVSASKPYDALGLEEVAVATGSKFTLNLLSMMSEVTDLEQDEPDSFEQEIADELSPISEVFANNVKVSFGDHSPNPEFDLLFGMSTEDILAVEVKDYSGTENDPSEKEIITTPSSNSGLVNADLTISVVKGAEPEELTSYKEQAELRGGVQICEKEQCAEVVKDYIEDTMVPRSIGNRRHGGQYGVRLESMK